MGWGNEQTIRARTSIDMGLEFNPTSSALAPSKILYYNSSYIRSVHVIHTYFLFFHIYPEERHAMNS